VHRFAKNETLVKRLRAGGVQYGTASPVENEIMIATYIIYNPGERLPGAESRRGCRGRRENEVVLAAERSDEKEPLTLVLITVDASEESKSPIQKEGEPVSKETAEQRSVQDVGCGTVIHVGNEAVIAADASEESKTPNQKHGEPVSEETAEQSSVPENEAMTASRRRIGESKSLN
jgi:hypothetical protein